MAGGGGSETTTTDPWSGQAPYLRDVFSQAQQQYYGGGPQYYPGSQVTPFSDQTQQAMGMTEQRAQGSPYEQGFQNYLNQSFNQPQVNLGGGADAAGQLAGGVGAGQNMLLQGGQNPFSDLGAAQQFASGGGDPYAQALQGMTGYGGLGEAQSFAGQPGTATPGATQLQQTSQGDFLGSNPYLDQMFDTASSRAGEAFNEQTMPGIAAQFGGAGRTGSGIHQNVAENASRQFGRDLQGMASDIYAPAYESERNRQLQAGSTLGQQDIGRRGLASQHYLGERGLGQDASQFGMSNALQQQGLAGSLYNQGQGNMMQAGGALGQLGLGGIGAMTDMYGNIDQSMARAGAYAPSAQQMDYNNINALMGVGGQVEGLAGQYLQDDVNRWNYYQNLPQQQLNQYSNLINQLPGGYGSVTSPSQQGGGLSGAAGGAMAGSAFGPWGAGIGGLLGLFG